MIIKINDFHPISHYDRSLIVSEYFRLYEISELGNTGWLNSLDYTYNIKETGKNPIVITIGSRSYHVKCRKTKTTIPTKSGSDQGSLVFDIWLSV